MGCGIVPFWGLNQCPLLGQADSQPLDHQRIPVQASPPLIDLFLIKGQLQYWDDFCHTSTWISHSYTYVPSTVENFNAAVLCSRSCPCRSSRNSPLSPQQDRSFCLLCDFYSVYEWENVIPFNIFRALRIVLVPQSWRFFATLRIVGHQAPCPWNSLGRNIRVCCHLLLQPWEWVLLYYKL